MQKTLKLLSKISYIHSKHHIHYNKIKSKLVIYFALFNSSPKLSPRFYIINQIIHNKSRCHNYNSNNNSNRHFTANPLQSILSEIPTLINSSPPLVLSLTNKVKRVIPTQPIRITQYILPKQLNHQICSTHLQTPIK